MFEFAQIGWKRRSMLKMLFGRRGRTFAYLYDPEGYFVIHFRTEDKSLRDVRMWPRSAWGAMFSKTTRALYTDSELQTKVAEGANAMYQSEDGVDPKGPRKWWQRSPRTSLKKHQDYYLAFQSKRKELTLHYYSLG